MAAKQFKHNEILKVYVLNYTEEQSTLKLHLKRKHKKERQGNARKGFEMKGNMLEWWL